MRTVQEFWSKVDTYGGPAGCWEWQAGRLRSQMPYGILDWRGKQSRAHRIAWELTHGPIPAGLCVCHSCDNPPCVNPAHLWLGTTAQNTRDRDIKGRTRGRTGKGPITGEMVERMMALKLAGWTYQAVADEVGVSLTTAYNRAKVPWGPKTHCAHGHPRTPDNVNSSNGCITCDRIRARDYQRRRRAALAAGLPWPPPKR